MHGDTALQSAPFPAEPGAYVRQQRLDHSMDSCSFNRTRMKAVGGPKRVCRSVRRDTPATPVH
jgi:hypothetical protein